MDINEEWFIDSFNGCNIVFTDVKESYSADEVISCFFCVKDKLLLDILEDCFVGLFSVGWESLASCKVKKSFSLVKKVSENDYRIDFEPSSTFKSNIDDFFQFCFYNSKSEVVYGASCPFQIFYLKDLELFAEQNNFKAKQVKTVSQQVTDNIVNRQERNAEFWLQEEEFQEESSQDFQNDTVIVHNKTTLLEQSLSAALKDKTLLQSLVSSLEHDIEKLEIDLEAEKEKSKEIYLAASTCNTKINTLSEQQNVLNELFKSSEETVKVLKVQLATANERLTNEYETKLSVLKDDLDTVTIDRKMLLDENRSLQKEINILINKLQERDNILQTKNDVLVKENQNQDQIIKEKVIESERLAKELLSSDKHFNEQLCKMKKSLSLCKIEREETLNKELYHENLEAVNKSLTDKNNLLSQQLKTKITENELMIKSLQTDCQDHFQENAKLTFHLETLLNEKKFLEDEISQLKVQKKDTDVDITTKSLHICNLNELTKNLKAELELETSRVSELTEKLSLKDENQRVSDTGSLHALQVASLHMQKQIRNLKKEKDKYSKLYNSSKKEHANHENLVKENTELKARICLGKQSYDTIVLQYQRLMKENVTSEKDVSVEAKALEKTVQELKERFRVSELENKSLREGIEELDMRNKNITQHFEEKLKIYEVENNERKYINEVTEPKLVKCQNVIGPVITQLQQQGVNDHKVIRNQPVQLIDGVFVPPSCHINNAQNLVHNFGGRSTFHSNYPLGSGAIPKHPKQQALSHLTPTAPPAQVILDRSSNALPHQLGSPISSERNNTPVSKCPICEMDFPVNFSSGLIEKHVNNHLK